MRRRPREPDAAHRARSQIAKEHRDSVRFPGLGPRSSAARGILDRGARQRRANCRAGTFLAMSIAWRALRSDSAAKVSAADDRLSALASPQRPGRGKAAEDGLEKERVDGKDRKERPPPLRSLIGSGAHRETRHLASPHVNMRDGRAAMVFPAMTDSLPRRLELSPESNSAGRAFRQAR